jgi:DNA mismatch repair protein MSH6
LNNPPADITPVPSSDAPDFSSPIKHERELTVGRNKENRLPLPVTKSVSGTDSVLPEPADVTPSSPTRKVREMCHYTF